MVSPVSGRLFQSKINLFDMDNTNSITNTRTRESVVASGVLDSITTNDLADSNGALADEYVTRETLPTHLTDYDEATMASRLYCEEDGAHSHIINVNCDGVDTEIELANLRSSVMVPEEIRTKEVIADIMPSVVNFTMAGMDVDPETGERVPMQWTGSGFVVDPEDLGLEGYQPRDGETLIATNRHVTDGAEMFRMKMFDGTIVNGKAKVLISNEDLDIAIMVVKTGDLDLKPAPIGYPEDVELGDTVLVFGSPLHLPFRVTRGMVANSDHENEDIQVDAAAYGGNSGGPVVDLGSGNVVGMLSYGIGDYDNFNFGIPVWRQFEQIRADWIKESWSWNAFSAAGQGQNNDVIL